MNRKLRTLPWNRMRHRLPHPDKCLNHVFPLLELNNIRWIFHQHTTPFHQLRELERRLYVEFIPLEDGISRTPTTQTTQPSKSDSGDLGS